MDHKKWTFKAKRVNMLFIMCSFNIAPVAVGVGADGWGELARVIHSNRDLDSC